MIAPRKLTWLLPLALCAAAGVTTGTAHGAGDAPYAAPPTDIRLLQGINFTKAQRLDPQLTAVYQACDQNQGYGGCYTDQAHNTVVLRFPDNTVFFDAKMAIDADGSALSKLAQRPNQPETSFRYPNPSAGATTTQTATSATTPDPYATGPGPSLDSERVPYVVMPLGDFRRESGIQLGDLAAVVKDGQLHFAIIGDLGPGTHIGEASMKLHMEFGRHICTSYDTNGNCSAFTDTSLDPPVLYFFFPDTRKLIIDGLTPDNINDRINTVGQQVWSAFLAHQRQDAGNN